ncbi:DUF916 and DUF3324 domain-containing protein [Enterococcus termitis]|uniref:Uncharacterized protein n=1 Tax=Enterococcus termitis TaxID=332950 RepID=A0A1E5H1F3_9ENTE|nr:DUF916 and DUF3324 domain-containing protein [Enterococcus termitis]OEG18635.1 hypothetical protein BCR25_15645 [Enterococcus termitis]OJG97648.1 hypothetical protein RV18_GL000716 [Enterococcus termitis]
MNKKIKKRNFYIIYIVLAFIITLSTSLVSLAEENKGAAGGFSYEVIQPENQQNKDVGYYDLRVTPGQEQIVQMKLMNSSEKEIKISVNLNGAKTNGNGVIEYSPNELKRDESLINDFVDIATAPKEVTLAPKSEQLLDIVLKIPKTPFKGVISGGIELQEVTSEGQKTASEKGMIVNKFAYLTGMLLSEEDFKGINPDMVLNKVYPELQNFQNAVFVNFSNISPVYTEDMTVNVQINKKGSKEVLYETKKSKMRMAPNSMIDFPVSLNGEKMVSGSYVANIVVTTKAGGKWAWTQEFKITDADAEKYNKKDLSLVQSTGINWLIIGAIVGVVLFVVGFIVVFLNLRKKKKEAKRKARRKRKKTKEKQ